MKKFIKITEQPSHYTHLEKMSVEEILSNINQEDKTVPLAVERSLPQIEKLASVIGDKMLAGGRLFYIGAGTSGRLGIVDASECPPTYGVPYGLVIGIFAGGDKAITHAVEFAEDSNEQGWNDLKKYDVNDKDVVLGHTQFEQEPQASERRSTRARGDDFHVLELFVDDFESIQNRRTHHDGGAVLVIVKNRYFHAFAKFAFHIKTIRGFDVF